MPLFLAAIFLSAFLLFQVQPVIARYILPWYGGSPAVWTTCLLFFQVGLLAGYAYAHGLVTFFRERRKLQAGIHFVLLLLAFLVLPITPDAAWKPDGTELNPATGIVRLLGFTVGFPYLLLSASGPLLQHWFAESHPGRSPYRLYAISNLGSLLGLLTYPFLFEPRLDVTQQTTLWSWAFAIYALLAIATGAVFLRRTAPLTGHGSTEAEGARPPVVDVLLWIAFSACGSMLLLSLTSQMCQDVAVVPFLWVVPLSLYLLTFVIAFDHERWYLRYVAIPLAAVAIGLTIWLMNLQYAADEWPLFQQIAVYCGAIFFACLVCHGEIVRMKPAVRHLTGFYLCISLGLMDAREAEVVKEIQTIARDSKYKADLLKDSAVGLGLLGDKELVPELVKMLEEAKGLASQAALASALGFIGDSRSIDPLVAMLKRKEGISDTARGFAAVALGIVADKELLPWNSKISTNINYRANTTTLTSSETGTGILDIL